MPETPKTCSCTECKEKTAAASKITKRMMAEQLKSGEHEGKVIAAIYRICSLLLQLHGLGRDIWNEQFKVSDPNSRLALHYLKLARTDLVKLGLRAAASIRQPSDLRKLTFITDLFPTHFETLLVTLHP